MKVILTHNAEDNLWDIFSYHAQYSSKYAEDFQNDLIDFLLSNLSKHPKLGHLYNTDLDLFRIVYLKRYIIYYLIKDDAIYIVYILDGRMQLNMDLSQSDATLPPLD